MALSSIRTDTQLIPVIDGEVAAPAMTWCRACGGGGDFFDGHDVYTCGICGGLGEHPVDHGPYGVAGDGIEAYYDPTADLPTETLPTAVPSSAPATTELPIWAGRPPVARARYVRRTRRARLTRWLVHAPAEQRLFVLLIVAAVAAAVTGLVLMEANWASDFLGSAR